MTDECTATEYQQICQDLVRLTAPGSYEEINQILVDSLQKLYPSSTIFLYRGRYAKDQRSNELMLCSGSDGEDPQGYKYSLIQYIKIATGDKVAATLIVCCKTAVQTKPQLNWLIEVFTNQLNHINQASLDKLTGLLTRDLFEFYIQRIYTENSQEKRRDTDRPSQCALAFIDIDDFKHVNDQFGHLIGDEVLLLISQVMKKTFRSDDLLFRFGGEEFVAILRDCDLQTCKVVLERFRKTIEDFKFPLIDHLTVSIGYTLINNHFNQDELLGRADKTLYYVKNNGKNSCCNYEELVEKKLIAPFVEVEGEIEIF